MPMGKEKDAADTAGGPRGNWREVLAVFLRLGLTSFGGPVAHLGYFREEFVNRRRWLDDRSYADLVALCQFLPGPASSQVGIAIGLLRAGYAGALAAWTGFTLPSALAHGAVRLWGRRSSAMRPASGWLHGLKVAAVAVVAQAVLGMARTLAPDRPRATLAVAAAIVDAGGAVGLGPDRRHPARRRGRRRACCERKPHGEHDRLAAAGEPHHRRRLARCCSSRC